MLQRMLVDVNTNLAWGDYQAPNKKKRKVQIESKEVDPHLHSFGYEKHRFLAARSYVAGLAREMLK